MIEDNLNTTDNTPQDRLRKPAFMRDKAWNMLDRETQENLIKIQEERRKKIGKSPKKEKPAYVPPQAHAPYRDGAKTHRRS